LVKISIVLADDSAAVLEDVRQELSDEFRILGTAANGEEAIREVLLLDPDVVILDVTMPGLTGLEVASRLREKHPRTKILLLTIHEEPEYISAGFGAGALGYVSKRRLSTDLPRAIRDVYEGRTFLSPSLKT